MHPEAEDNGQITYDAALKRAARICARSEQCGAAIRRRLAEWGVAEDVSARVVEYLYENSYIDDSRYIRSFVNDKFRFGKWGRHKIRHALNENGLSGPEVETALKKTDEDEYHQALQKAVSEKARQRGGIKTIADRASVYNFCLMRGYESELVNSAIEEYITRNEEQKDKK